jgi:cytochrome d ubiquinol oxidase subunit II
VVGGVASGRVPPGIATGDVVDSWANPTSALGGVLAVLTCAYLAAVFLCGDAQREGSPDLAEGFRVRAIGTAVLTGAVGLGGLFVLRTDAPRLFDGLTGRTLPIVVVSTVAGDGAILLLVRRRYTPARVASALAVAAILARARVSLEGLSSFEVQRISGVLDGSGTAYQVELRVWFTLLERMHG